MEVRIAARKAELEALLGRSLEPVSPEAPTPLSEEDRQYLLDQAQELYWNELEWEHITEEERLGNTHLVEQTFPGVLAFVRGLLLDEVMPDALAGAEPRPGVVQDILDFLGREVADAEARLAKPDPDDDPAQTRAEAAMTEGLMDLVMGVLYGLEPEEMERVRSRRAGD